MLPFCALVACLYFMQEREHDRRVCDARSRGGSPNVFYLDNGIGLFLHFVISSFLGVVLFCAVAYSQFSPGLPAVLITWILLIREVFVRGNTRLIMSDGTIHIEEVRPICFWRHSKRVLSDYEDLKVQHFERRGADFLTWEWMIFVKGRPWKTVVVLDRPLQFLREYFSRAGGEPQNEELKRWMDTLEGRGKITALFRRMSEKLRPSFIACFMTLNALLIFVQLALLTLLAVNAMAHLP